MNVPRIIGLSGVAGTGKDTVCEMLMTRIPLARRFAFADELKRTLRQLVLENTGIDTITCNREQKNIIRPILVGFGMMMRNISPEHWIKKLQDSIESIEPSIVIVTDVRYPNEAAWIKSHSGIIVHISRVPHIQPTNDEEATNDPIIRGIADIRFDWPTLDLTYAIPHIEFLLDSIAASFAGRPLSYIS